MLVFRPDRLLWRGKFRVGEGPDRDADQMRHPLRLPEHACAAAVTEVEGNRHPASRASGESSRDASGAPHPRAIVERGDTESAPGAALAIGAVAHGNARRLALTDESKRTASAGGVARFHGGPAGQWGAHLPSFNRASPPGNCGPERRPTRSFKSYCSGKVSAPSASSGMCGLQTTSQLLPSGSAK